MVVSSSVSAAAHADHPPGLGHLVIHLPEGGGHLVGQGPGHDDDVRLSGGCSEHNAVPGDRSSYREELLSLLSPVHVVSGGGDVHHLHGAAGQAEGERP